jgi:hypothetical protein
MVASLVVGATTVPGVGVADAQPAPGAGWLEVLNFYRSSAGLPPVAEDPALSPAASLHAKYIVEAGLYEHYEDPNNPLYTPQGDAAGRHSEIQTSGGRPPSDERQAVEAWVTAPFHAFGLFSPNLVAAGFGLFSDPNRSPYSYASVLDVGDDLTPGVPTTVGFPVRFPGPGSTVALTAYPGFEHPDPLTSCPGYKAPTGIPILVRFAIPTPGADLVLTHDGSPVVTCSFDGTNYTNPEPADQALGRSGLTAVNGLVAFPRAPLSTGAYEATLRVAGSPDLTWRFTIGGKDVTPNQEAAATASRTYSRNQAGDIALVAAAIASVVAYRRRPGPRRRRQWRVVFVLAIAGWAWSSWHQQKFLAPGLKSNIGVAALDLALVVGAVLLVTRVRRQHRGTWKPPPGFFDVGPAQQARKY